MNEAAEFCGPSIVSIQQGSVALERALFTGRVFYRGDWWVAVPREVVAATPSLQDLGAVIFELNRSVDLKKPPFWKILLMALRPSLWGLTVFPCVSVACYFSMATPSGLTGVERGSWGFAISALLGIVLLQITCQTLGDIEDFRRLLDLPGTRGGSPVLRKGWMTAQQLKRISQGAFCLSLLFGLPALLQDAGLLFAAGGGALLGGLVYVGRSLGVKYQHWGEALLFVLLGPGLTTGFAWAAFHWMNGTAILIGILFGGLAVALSRIHRLQNLTASMLTGSDGFRWVQLFLMYLYGALGVGVILCVYFKFVPWPILIGLVPAVLMSVKIVLQLRRVSGPASALLHGLRKDVWLLHGYVGVGLSLGFFISRKLI